MTKEKYYDRFFEWQNYAHYVILVIGIALFINLFHFDVHYWPHWGYLALFTFAWDSLIHGLFWILPKPFKWRS